MNGRRIAGILLLISSLILFLVAVPVFFDLNRYKPELTGWLKARVGSDIAFAGKLEWSLFPEPGLTVEQVTIANPPGFEGQPLIAIDHGEIELETLALLARRVAIKRLIIDGFTLNVRQDSDGIWNVKMLAGKNQSPPTEPGLPDINSVKQWLSTLTALDELTLTRGQINWENRQSGDKLFFSNIRFKIDKVLPETYFKIALETQVSKPSSPLPAVIKLSSEMHFADTGLRWLFDNSQLKITDCETLLPFRLPSISATANVSSYDWRQDVLRVGVLQVGAAQASLAVKDLVVAHSSTEPEVKASVEIPAFNLKALLTQLAFPTGMLANDDLSSAAATFNVQASGKKMEVKNIDLKLDNTQINGVIRLENFDKPKINFSLTAGRLELDRYLPKPHPAVNSGSARQLNTHLLNLLLNQLKKLQAQGELMIANLSFGAISMEDIRLQVQSDKDKLGMTQASGIKK
jgi:AsmA protein